MHVTHTHRAAAHMRMATASPLRMLLLTGPLSALGSLCIDMYLPALPSISRDLHAGTSATQASLTTCLIGLALAITVVGLNSAKPPAHRVVSPAAQTAHAAAGRSAHRHRRSAAGLTERVTARRAG